MVYRCGDGAGNAIVGIAFMLGAGLIGLLCLLGIVGVIGNAGVGAVVALPVCALVAFVGWRQARGFPTRSSSTRTGRSGS